MKPKVFKKNHFYKFKDGRVMYVMDICHCNRCESRGLNEPYVVWLDSCAYGWNTDYITEFDYKELIDNIDIETPNKEEWVENYIMKTVNDNKNRLLRDMTNFIAKGLSV